MQYWHTIYITPSDSQELFLVKTFRPFLEKNVWNHTGLRAFFQRETTGQGTALVLNLFLSSPELDPLFLKNLPKKGTLLSSPQVQPLPNETPAQRWIREFQHICCRVLLDQIAKPNYEYSDARLDILKMQFALLHAAGLNKKEVADYCTRLLDLQLQQLKETTDITNLRTELIEEVKPQFSFLKEVLGHFYVEITGPNLSKSTWLRWVRGTELIAEGMQEDFERYLPLLIGICNDQMGIYQKTSLGSLVILSQVLTDESPSS